jgi:hypothetical protein
VDARDVGDAVADVALAEARDDLGRDGDAERACDRLRERGDGRGAAGADVERRVGDVLALEGQAEGLDDVGDVDEVAALPAVLEDERALGVEEARREDRPDAGVRVAEGRTR